MKIFFRRIHLYLALAAGLIIMTTCLTGAILVFEQELQRVFHKERYYVVPGEYRVAIALLTKTAKDRVANSEVTSVKVFSDENRSVEIGINIKQAKTEKSKGEKKEASKTPARENNRRVVYMNPYTGEILEVYNHQDSFFYKVMSLHRWMLGGDIGKLIVGISTSIFLFILITGIILWWPRTKIILSQRLKLKFNAGWKRINHDLHIVMGFYTAIFLFIFAFTGLAWSFDWFNEGIYKVTGSSMQQFKPPVSEHHAGADVVSFDEVLDASREKITDVVFYNISAPRDSVSPYIVNVLPAGAIHETASDNYYVDRYSGKIVASQKFSERNTGQKVRSTFRPIHVSSIFGVPSKIVGLIVCILGTSFPITGYIMWINRIRKKKIKVAGQSINVPLAAKQ